MPPTLLDHPRFRPVFRALFGGVKFCLRASGLYARGMRNALDIRLNRLEVALEGLPAAFDGYTILHMSDLHADGPLDFEEPLSRLLATLDIDLCALTGDYRYRLRCAHDAAAEPMARILRHVSARDGVVGVLGNHDLGTMIGPLRRAGIAMLVNDCLTLRRGSAEIHLIGLDDVHAYQPAEEAVAALAAMPEGFRILLLHSPELIGAAADAGVSLYLTGHTHGGQICLPGGFAPMVNIRAPRRYARGLWHHGRMTGHTSCGVGVSAMPLRYFSRGEITVITLRRG
ncbi:MAG: metallophosphoesterase [Rhodospirillaceae bacterium]